MKKYLFDYSKLLGKIKECSFKQDEFAKKIGLSATSFSYKINNKRSFTQTEIINMVKYLGILETNISEYFFKEKV